MRSKRPLARQCKKLVKQYVDDPDVPAAPNGDSEYAEWVQIALILIRVELDKSLRETEAWFNDSTAILDEFGLERAPHYRSFCRWEHETALRLMGDCGLRRAEVLDVCPDHISRYTDGRHYRLEVVGGKDTTGEYDNGKHRETWLPAETERILHRYTHQQDLAPDDPVINRSPRTLLYWVEKATVRAAEETGETDYYRVSSHDLRRCWANHLLVEEGISPRIVMALSGWSSYDAIEPYLAAPTEENIVTSMSNVAL